MTAAVLGSAAIWEDFHLLAEVVPAACTCDISLDATRAPIQGSREDLSRGALWPEGHCYRDLRVTMAVKCDSVGPGKGLFPLQPCSGEVGTFELALDSCMLLFLVVAPRRTTSAPK